MDRQEIFSYIDHTLLRADATWEDIKTLCDEAVENKVAAVCIPPSYVKRVRDEYKDLRISTVVGFPLGYHTREVKIAEASQALSEGADEIDMVINIGDVKNGDFDKVILEISQVKEAIGDRVLKVIIETCYLTEGEKVALCHCVTKGKADYIKTSTGFGSHGAKFSDIELFKSHIGSEVKIKAAGGIREKEDMVSFIEMGCQRLGTSSAVHILNRPL